MSRFSVDTVSIQVGDGEYFFLNDTFEYISHVAELNYFPLYPQLNPQVNKIIIEPFWTDLATVPLIGQWLVVKKLGKHNLPSILHDYLLQHRGLFPQYSRRLIAKIYQEALIDAGVPEFQCKIIYHSVRVNDWLKEEAPWKK